MTTSTGVSDTNRSSGEVNMTRLKIFAALGLLLALGAGARADETPGKTAPATEETTYDWGVAYYMSYDNNLEGCGKIIIKGITQGVADTGSRTIAAVQADFTDSGGMHRYTITSAGKTEEKVDSEDSASEDQAIAYLEWFTQKFKCKHYVVTFLDHGGRLDDMCNDGQPGPSGKEWMSGKILGEKMRKLREKLGDKWELFFLQQCGRGSIENLYSFRGTAKYVMSSPVPVGAPNTYYTALHKWLGENPELKGSEIADKIMKEDEHYTIYTCLDTAKLDELPKKLDAALEPFLAKKELKSPALPRVIHPVGEPIVDAKTYFEALAKENELDEKSVESFFEWAKKELFTAVKFHGGRELPLCGLSIFAPQTTRDRASYERLDIYKSSKLMELWQKLPLPEKVAKKTTKKGK
jgi:hypothetical protein